MLSKANKTQVQCKNVSNLGRARATSPLGREPVREPVSSRPFFSQPEQVPGPRARIRQGRVREKLEKTVVYFGVDVSRRVLDVADDVGTTFQVANDPAGHAELVARVSNAKLVVMEGCGRVECAA